MINEQTTEEANSAASPARSNRALATHAWAVSLIVALSLLVVGGFIFRDFLFGDKLLLYTDVGADSVNDTYPTFVHLHDYIRQHGLPTWSFYVGMGQNIVNLTGDLIWEPAVWLPRHLIAPALVYQHLLKALIAGLLFFRFLRLRDLNLCASLTGALALAYSAHMCMGSCWIITADDTVCFTFVLFAAEEAIVCRRWFYLPIAVALAGLITVFHLYLSAVLLCLYVSIRLLEIYGWKPLALSRLCARLAMPAFLGVGLGAIVFLASFYLVLHTPRGSGTIPNFNFGSAPSPFQLGSPLHYLTALLRPISNDIVGNGDAYRGWEDYYEGPASYCGLLSLLFFPQVFVGATSRRRILYSVLLLLTVIPIIFPWFRYLFWLFEGGYFRAFSLFSIFVFLGLSMTALSTYTASRTINFWTLGVALAVLLGILHSPIRPVQALVSHEIAWMATFFLIVYAGLFVIGHVTKRQSIAGWVILGVAALELMVFSRITVNRPTITKAELKERIGYNDETVDAVRDINAGDNSFFRITKTWGSTNAIGPGYNDAMAFGYYGTSAYTTYNNLDYFKFLMAVDAIDRSDIAGAAQSSPGLFCCPLLRIFACEKYVITDNPVPFQIIPEYELVRRYGDIYVLRNQLSLPLGLTFTDWISEDDFSRLPSEAKALALLNTAVLSVKDAPSRSDISTLTLLGLSERMRERSRAEVLTQLRATAFKIQSLKQTDIAGTIQHNQNGILIFQMPFDAGWRCLVDGRNTATMKVDVGLLGILLTAGQHTVKLTYRPPLLLTGAVITVISCLAFAFSIWRWPRLPQMP